MFQCMQIFPKKYLSSLSCSSFFFHPIVYQQVPSFIFFNSQQNIQHHEFKNFSQHVFLFFSHVLLSFSTPVHTNKCLPGNITSLCFYALSFHFSNILSVYSIFYFILFNILSISPFSNSYGCPNIIFSYYYNQYILNLITSCALDFLSLSNSISFPLI